MLVLADPYLTAISLSDDIAINGQDAETVKPLGDNLFDGKPNNAETFFDVDEIEIEIFERKPEFHGFLKLGWPIHGHNEDAFEESSNIYDQTELTLWFGIDVLENLSFATEIELEDGFKEFTFETFQFDWNIINELISLRFGRFIYPFGIERYADEPTYNKLVTRPTPFMRIIPGTYSDNGMEIFGITPLIAMTKLKYEIAMTTGLSGISRKGEQGLDENNDNKFIGGRLGVVISPGFEIGASYSTGEYDDNDQLRLDFIGFDLAFQKWGFELRSEYIKSNVEGDNITTSSFDRDGYYTQISYKYMPEFNYLRSLEGVARFDSVDPNDIVTNESDTDRLSLGVNYSPTEHLMFKLEYALENEAKESLEKNLLLQAVFSW